MVLRRYRFGVADSQSRVAKGPRIGPVFGSRPCLALSLWGRDVPHGVSGKEPARSADVTAAYERLATIQEEEILRIHEKAAEGQHRGTGVRDPRKLKRLAADLRRSSAERRDVVEIIAATFDDIERDPQPFVDCNHRTAMHLGRFIAFEFGFKLKYSGPEGRRLRKEWETMSRKKLQEWVRAHLVPFKRD